MTRLVFSARALDAIERLTDFLRDHLPEEAERTGEVILEAMAILQNHPAIGRPIEHGLRELVISRGRSGYLALYEFDDAADVVIILALRHQRESGYE